MKYIFVTGGVVSSLGKGIISASIGKLLQARGFSVTIQKFDPYINIDPGTLNPYEHGECYVTHDGVETDLDLGHYERFLDFETSNPEKALGTVDIKAEKDPFKARITLIPPIVSHIVIGETCIFPREFIESIYDRSPAHQRLQKFDNMKIEKRKNGM